MTINDILNCKFDVNEQFVSNIMSQYIQMAKQITQNHNVENFRNLFKQFLNSDSYSAGTTDDMQKVHDLNDMIINNSKSKGTYVPDDKTGFNPIANNQLGWSSYQSWHLENQCRYNKGDISHRFYINVKASELSNFIETLMKLYENKNIPYYFKVNMDSQLGCKDSLVLYCSTAQLEKTITILNYIQNNFPNLINNCGTPHIFTAPVSSWVGYASESKTQNDSYTGIITNSFINCFSKSINDWIKENPNQYVNFNGKTIPLREYYDNKLLDDESKETIGDIKRDRIDYIRRTAHLLSVIPRIDNSFTSRVLKNFQEELIKCDINPRNMCFNNSVQSELSRLINSSENLNHAEERIDELSKARKEYVKSMEKPESDLTLFRNEYQTMMNGLNNTSTTEDLARAREEYIKQINGDSFEPVLNPDDDGSYSNHMTLPTKSNGMHR